MPRRLRCALALVAVLLPFGAFAQSPGAALSGFVVSDLDGRPVNLAVYSGRPLVINFWARWCAPCRKEIPDLVAMDAKYRSKGVVILGLAVEEAEQRQAVGEFARTYAVAYPILLTGTGKGVELMSALGNNKGALPFTVVLDKSGKLVTRKIGAMSKTEMDAAIETALR